MAEMSKVLCETALRILTSPPQLQVFKFPASFSSCSSPQGTPALGGPLLTILFFSWLPGPGARSLCAGTGALGCDQPVGLRLLGLLDKAEGEAEWMR